MSKKGKKVWERVYNERTSYLMLLPNIIMFAVFTVYPILWALRYMLFDYRGYGEAKFVGMDNFVRVFTRDPVFWDSVVNTFIYVGGKLILTLPIAFMLAFLLSKSTRINAVSQSIVFTPTIMSSAVMALIFYLLFNTYNGEINRFLMWLGVIDENINWLGVQHAMLTVIILAVWGGVGNYMVYFIAGLTGISTDVYESAKLDGANGAPDFVPHHDTAPGAGSEDDLDAGAGDFLYGYAEHHGVDRGRSNGQNKCHVPLYLPALLPDFRRLYGHPGIWIRRGCQPGGGLHHRFDHRSVSLYRQ